MWYNRIHRHWRQTGQRVPYAKISHPVPWKFPPTNKDKNLDVTFDSGNIFTSHITKVCHAWYHYLRDFRRIRKFLSVETAAMLANSMISSRINFCSSLLYGVNKYNMAKLKIQNGLCKIVFRLYKTSHFTFHQEKIHWLPISYCILFKYNLITFKTIKFSRATYLSSLIKTSSLTRENWLSLSSVCPRKAICRWGFAMASPTE